MPGVSGSELDCSDPGDALVPVDLEWEETLLHHLLSGTDLHHHLQPHYQAQAHKTTLDSEGEDPFMATNITSEAYWSAVKVIRSVRF